MVAGIRDEQSTFGRYHQPPRQGDGRFGNAVAHPVLHRQEIIGAWRESDAAGTNTAICANDNHNRVLPATPRTGPWRVTNRSPCGGARTAC